MARTRLVAALLAVAVLLSLAGAGAAVAAPGKLKPSPPNSLPAHKPGHTHRSSRRHGCGCPTPAATGGSSRSSTPEDAALVRILAFDTATRATTVALSAGDGDG